MLEILLIAKYRANGTVKSYRSDRISPPWSFKSYISLESSPYFPVRTSCKVERNYMSVSKKDIGKYSNKQRVVFNEPSTRILVYQLCRLRVSWKPRWFYQERSVAMPFAVGCNHVFPSVFWGWTFVVLLGRHLVALTSGPVILRLARWPGNKKRTKLNLILKFLVFIVVANFMHYIWFEFISKNSKKFQKILYYPNDSSLISQNLCALFFFF